jgi:hypothetical protein
MSDDRLPTGLWVDAHLRQLETQAVPYYIINRGNHASGTLLLKLFAPGQGCKLLQQQRTPSRKKSSTTKKPTNISAAPSRAIPTSGPSKSRKNHT